MIATLDPVGLRESRLRCMLDKNGLWSLNDEDRAAIQWAFDRIKTLEAGLDRSRAEYIAALDRSNKTREKFRTIRDLIEQALHS